MNESESGWKVEIGLGSRIVVAGRIRTPDGQIIVGDGKGIRPNYAKCHSWLPTVRTALETAGAALSDDEKRGWQRRPDEEAGHLKNGQVGFFGGWEIEIIDVLVATWSAFGGAKGVTAFVKLYKEIKSLRDTGGSVEITAPDGTKIKVSNEKDLERVLETVKRFEKKLP